jgi:hypothetical protein
MLLGAVQQFGNIEYPLLDLHVSSHTIYRSRPGRGVFPSLWGMETTWQHPPDPEGRWMPGICHIVPVCRRERMALTNIGLGFA